MGTLRWEKEAEEDVRKERQSAEFETKRRELEFSEANTLARINALQLDLERQRGELALYSSDRAARLTTSSEKEKRLHKMRSAGPKKTSAVKRRNKTSRSRKSKEKTGDGAEDAS
jgi:hypothetical protein